MTGPPKAKLVEAMEKGFENLRTENRPYHVQVMLSGGKDSTYALYLMKEVYHLRPVACHVLHPFVKPLATRNAERAAEHLGVDLIKFQANHDVWKRVLRFAVLNGPRYGLSEMFGCEVCSALYGNISSKLALHLRVACMVDGYDRALRAGPVLIDSRAMRARHLGPKRPISRVIHDALGPEYQGSIYDTDFAMFAKMPFPARMSPLTFVEYDYIKAIRELDARGIVKTADVQSRDTNCDLLHLWSYLGFRRHGCHPYVRVVSQALRRGHPTYIDEFLSAGDQLLSRDELLVLLEEYQTALFYVADHPEASEDELAALQGRMPFTAKKMGAETLSVFLERSKAMHPMAELLGLDWADVVKAAE